MISISGQYPVDWGGAVPHAPAGSFPTPTLNYYNDSTASPNLHPDILTIVRWLQSLGSGPIPSSPPPGMSLHAFSWTPQTNSDSFSYGTEYTKYLI